MKDNDKELWIKLIRNSNLYYDNRKLARELAQNKCCVKDGRLYGLYIFRNNFTYLNIPQGITSIQELAFANWTNLASITIPNSVISIGDGAFCGCESLEGVTIPNSVASIGDEAFCKCTSLKSMTIPDSITRIGYGTFWGCNSLESITIPNSMKIIENDSIPTTTERRWYTNFEYCINNL